MSDMLTIAAESAAEADHPLVGQLRDMLAKPAAADLGALASLIQKLYAEMHVVGGPVRAEPDLGGGAAPAYIGKGEAVEGAEHTVETVEHHLHTSEQHFSDGNLPF